MPENSASPLPRSAQFLYGAFGAGIQDIILFYSKRFTAPSLDFNLLQYGSALAIYCVAAGIVSTIYPYRGALRPWKSFVVGLVLPTIVGGIIATAQRAESQGLDVTVRGPPPAQSPQGAPATVYGDLLDLLALI
jgi:hypothetical protein